MYDPYRPPPPPPPRTSFWTRPKVGGVGLVLGLLVGVAGAGGQTDEPTDDEAGPAPASPTVTVTAEPSTTQAAPDGFTQDDLDRAVERATTRGDARTQRLLAAQRAQSTARMRTVRRQARTDQRAAVRAAVRQTRAQSSPPVEVPVVETPPVQKTDPQFSYCYEANDAGYGNYVSGVDPEYDWYDDADGDGRVCEF